MRLLSWLLFLAGIVGFTAPFDRPASANVGVERALPLLQASARTWTERSSCTSCHHQSLGSLAIAVARERGFKVDNGEAMHQIQAVIENRSDAILRMYVGGGSINGQLTFSYALLGLGAEATPKEEMTDAMVHFLRILQASDGGWASYSHRQPLEDARESATALALRALQLYGEASDADRLKRAAKWLEACKPEHQEGRAMRLLGLVWAKAGPRPMRSALDAVARAQGKDGGWSQLPGLPSDSYATGQAVVALRMAGVGRTDRRIRRAITFLQNTQQADGSWRVATRRKTEGLPYFETGFPHGEDQFISFAGSAWATMALALDGADVMPPALVRSSVPEGAVREHRFADSPRLNALFVAIAHGTTADVEAALNAGADPKAKNLAGNRPLEWAVFDTEKSALLLSRGADPQEALHAAAHYGTLEVLRRLVDAGADVREPDSDGLSVLVHAALSLDIKKLEFLLGRGAKADVDGDVPPLAAATWAGNIEGAKRLLAAGADPSFPLTDAVVDLNEPIVRLLLSHKANPNSVDESGRTPLHYAAMMFAGHDRYGAQLLRAGADPSVRDPDGLTALELARKHKNKPMIELLEKNRRALRSGSQARGVG
ncbi:MAG: ankyrin repeat domain-containing protein [Fimbriimonadaceae bacterium]|nr:ankyrin repeat domain-containing protein [Chthonomonadaceae bacterium]MCO5296386.1 ankyrin repeat domain-containing protein [Fimbriimonadaceae bacterium]